MRCATARALLLASGLVSARTAPGAIVPEVYRTRAAFDARLAGAVRVVTFDDIDTTSADPAAFAADRYADTVGMVITGDAGQFASPDFGFPSAYPTSSPPNAYAPGPTADTFGGGNGTEVTFLASSAPAAVAGFGAVFVDPDLPGVTSLTVFDRDGTVLAVEAVPAADGELVFRGVVTVDGASGTPVPAIARVGLVNGTGWPGGSLNDGVLLDDFVSGIPVSDQVTTTTVPGASTTTTTLPVLACAPVPAVDCRKPVVSSHSMLVVRDQTNDTRDTLVWVWGRGAATTKDDFGDPPGVTGFVLCLYDATGMRLMVGVPAGGTCAGRLCWRTTPAGFLFRDPGWSSHGALVLRLKAGTDGRARIALVARGDRLAPPALPLAPPVSVQLVRPDGGRCWDARFSLTRTRTRRLLRARSD